MARKQNLIIALALLVQALTVVGRTSTEADTLAPQTVHRSPAEEAAYDVVERAFIAELHRYPGDPGVDCYIPHVMAGKSERWLRRVLRLSKEGRRLRQLQRKKQGLICVIVMIPLVALALVLWRSRDRKVTAFKVSLVALSAAVAIFTMEIVLRVKASTSRQRGVEAWRGLGKVEIPKAGAHVLLHHIIRLSENPRIVYELIPDISVRFMGANLTVTTDSVRKTPGASATEKTGGILGLGDSVMFGWGVGDGDTYLSYLAHDLRSVSDSPGWQVVNTAVPGYNTVMQVETLKTKGARYQPDVVLIHFVENDLLMPNFIRVEDQHAPVTRLHVVAALSQWVGGRRRTAPAERLTRPYLTRDADQIPEKYRFMVGVKAYRTAMRELGAMAVTQGFDVIILCSWQAPEYLKEAAQELDFELIEMGAIIAAYAEAQGIVKVQGSELTVSRNDPHFSAIGHRLIADELLPIVKRKLRKHH